MKRIVSLLPAATEVAAALGLMEQVVGVSHECDFPSAANARAPARPSIVRTHDLGRLPPEEEQIACAEPENPINEIQQNRRDGVPTGPARTPR